MITPPIGLSHQCSIRVDDTLIVPRLPKALAAMADMPPVFATAYMVAFVEATCIEALAPYLEAGEVTVGTHVNISHVAATPVGLVATAQVELVAAEGRKLIFRVRCYDETDLIGEGLHERCVVNREQFIFSVEAKSIR